MIIYLNVGGTLFETTDTTLLNCRYFDAVKRLNGEITSSKEKPYFIDHDPKGFRHVLNLCRDPDYKFPEKYYWVLNFWQFEFTITDNKDIIPRCDAPKFNIEKLESPIYLNKDPIITYHKKIFNRATPCYYKLEGKSFDTLPWQYTFKAPIVYQRGWILMPKNLTFDEFKYFELKMLFDDRDEQSIIFARYLGDTRVTSITYNLEFLLRDNFIYHGDKYAQFNETIHIINGYYYIPLVFPLCIDPPVVNNYKSISLSMICLDDKYKNINIQVRFASSKISQMELDYAYKSQTIIPFVKEIKFQNVDRVKLEPGYLRYMIWKTEDKIEKITIESGCEQYVEMSRGDFQYLERNRVNFPKLPKNYGSIYFCKFPHEYNSDSGGIYITNDSSYIYGTHINFQKKTSGTIWLSYFKMLSLSSSKFLIEDIK